MKNNINGIDVSECRFYEPKAQKMTCHEETITKPCESTPICYYKLLQKSYIEIQRLQEENEKLKKLKKYYKGFVANCKFCDEWYMDKCNYIKKDNKYNQALEEIKEMILGFGNTPIEFKTLNIPLKEEDLKTNEGKFFDFYKKLKDKINEVLNDRD